MTNPKPTAERCNQQNREIKPTNYIVPAYKRRCILIDLPLLAIAFVGVIFLTLGAILVALADSNKTDR